MTQRICKKDIRKKNMEEIKTEVKKKECKKDDLGKKTRKNQ